MDIGRKIDKFNEFFREYNIGEIDKGFILGNNNTPLNKKLGKILQFYPDFERAIKILNATERKEDIVPMLYNSFTDHLWEHGSRERFQERLGLLKKYNGSHLFPSLAEKGLASGHEDGASWVALGSDDKALVRAMAERRLGQLILGKESQEKYSHCGYHAEQLFEKLGDSGKLLEIVCYYLGIKDYHSAKRAAGVKFNVDSDINFLNNAVSFHVKSDMVEEHFKKLHSCGLSVFYEGGTDSDYRNRTEKIGGATRKWVLGKVDAVCDNEGSYYFTPLGRAVKVTSSSSSEIYDEKIIRMLNGGIFELDLDYVDIYGVLEHIDAGKNFMDVSFENLDMLPAASCDVQVDKVVKQYTGAYDKKGDGIYAYPHIRGIIYKFSYPVFSPVEQCAVCIGVFQSNSNPEKSEIFAGGIKSCGIPNDTSVYEAKCAKEAGELKVKLCEIRDALQAGLS